jgi:hypothetical protein
MFSSIWDFLKDIATGIWAVVVRFMPKNGDNKPSKPSVSADRGSVAAAGSIENSPININARVSSERPPKNSDHKPSKPRGRSKR